MVSKRSKKSTIIESLFDAQKIAFSPFVFQAVVVAKKRGILEAIGSRAMTRSELAAVTGFSDYALKIVTEVLLTASVIKEENRLLSLTSTGECLTFDRMTEVNLNFASDVCYRGLSHLEEALDSSKPKGLCELGPWETIYPALSELPEPARSSWFAFDHFHSDQAFCAAIEVIKEKLNPRHIFDVGGNTGKFARVALEKMSECTLTLVDLPEQCQLVKANADLDSVRDRLSTASVNWLDLQRMPDFEAGPTDADLIWMSQFLDCFSDSEVVSILKRLKHCLRSNGRIVILESFWDEQKYPAAAMSLACTSMYFTTMANGNSRFFSGEELRHLIGLAGLEVEDEVAGLGVSMTMLICKDCAK